MHYVYVLRSETKRRFYTGYTHDLRKRLGQHNDGRNTSTRYGVPWRLLYYEAYETESQARDREAVLKKRGRVWQSLRSRLVKSGGK
ncbi:MAG: GIY-YIG nuclease family protein [Candidatus Pacebacteria bacterium]|nr:GIY-YIG nuclease family protein [Candidatus Paceibacterota bacterium]MBP9840010.1 GIY-YIG nuclease family protein [Candidatus Paceibacterota bacterium]